MEDAHHADAMTPELLAWLRGLIASGNERLFYKTKEWRLMRREVLKLDKGECQRCKRQGKYEAASMVHHVIPLTERPDLALSIWHEGKRQLLSLSDQCHEIEHHHRHEQKEPLTPERW